MERRIENIYRRGRSSRATGVAVVQLSCLACRSEWPDCRDLHPRCHRTDVDSGSSGGEPCTNHVYAYLGQNSWRNHFSCHRFISWRLRPAWAQPYEGGREPRLKPSTVHAKPILANSLIPLQNIGGHFCCHSYESDSH